MGISRRGVILGGAALVAAAGAGWLKFHKKPVPIGFEVSEEELMAARAFLKAHPAIDSHAHPGRTFVRGATGLKGKLKLYKAMGTFEDKSVAAMRAGGAGAASFAAVSDFQILGIGKTGLSAIRDFKPGEALESYKRQIRNLKALQTRGLVTYVTNENALDKVNAAGGIAALLTVEGGDFLEGQAERVAMARADGVQSITLLHYHTNELGDIMTAPPVHGGLTEAGRAVVQAMNAAHMLIDVAHASEDTLKDVLAASTAPLMCSHTHIKGPNVPDIPRYISRELALEIAGAGGVIGAWPAGFGITSLAGYLDRIMELIGIVGIDHVVLGTDMDANYKPVMESYAKMPWLVAGLKKRGLSDVDLAKFLRGNFLRVWAAA